MYEENIDRSFMSHIVPPKTGPVIDRLTRISRQGETRWRDEDGQMYIWDSLHGEFEVFTKRGRHLGAIDSQTGKLIKDAVPGRKIDV